jgi:hypothetical protein
MGSRLALRFNTLLLYVRFRIKIIGAMPAIALAAIPSFEMIYFCKNLITFFTVIKIFRF